MVISNTDPNRTVLLPKILQTRIICDPWCVLFEITVFILVHALRTQALLLTVIILYTLQLQ